MFESITYEVILQRMIDRILLTAPNLDTREGSIIFNALAPAAVELQNMYIQLDAVLNESFADTASREYLIKRAAERGITPEPASKAILQAAFNIDVAIGSRFSLGDLNYVAVEKISAGVFKVQCETAGIAANDKFGSLIPIEYIDGLTSAELTDLLIPGQDEEGTEILRQRYFENLESQSFGGNVADYKTKTNALDGVGGVKVYPAWNGGGTVKLVIIDSTNSKPTEALISAVQEAIDPAASSGEGSGIAPIGHIVTVVGVEETLVNIATTITYESGWDWASLEPYAQAAIDAYFSDLSAAWDWDDEAVLIVRISQIESRFLDLTGVVDITGTTINTVATNLVIAADKIPVRGDLIG